MKLKLFPHGKHAVLLAQIKGRGSAYDRLSFRRSLDRTLPSTILNVRFHGNTSNPNPQALELWGFGESSISALVQLCVVDLPQTTARLRRAMHFKNDMRNSAMEIR